MAPAAFAKPSYIGGALGVAATPAVGYGGWALYDNVLNPTAESTIAGEGYGPQVLDSNLDIANSTSTSHKKYDCFRNFFPGSEDITTYSSDVSGQSWSTDKNSIFNSPDPTYDDAGPTQPLGCVIMQLKYNGRNSDNKNKFLFKSEVAVKAGKFGLVLWNKFKRDEHSSDDEIKFENTIIFLEQTSPGQWSVTGAFDQEEDMEDAELSKLHISVESTAWTIDDNSAHANSERKFTGVWEADDGGQEIFRGLKVNYDDKEWFVLNGRYPAAGQNQNSFDGYKFFNDGDEKKIYIYDKAGKKWPHLSCESGHTDHRNKVKESIKKALNTFYAPFRGRRGKWKEFKRSMCDEMKGRRRNEVDDLEKIKSFCYRKGS